MKLRCIKIFCYIVFMQVVNGENNKTLKTRMYSLDFLPQEDILGGLVIRVVEPLLKTFGVHKSTATNNSCIPLDLNIDGYHELILNVFPFGNCPYCCPIKNLTNHIDLYFTNKYMSGSFAHFKPIRKRGSLKSIGIKRETPTIIYFHGFTEAGKGFDGNTILNAYLARDEEYNIILVDWKTLSAGPWYNQATRNTKVVGKIMGRFLSFYNRSGEMDLSKVHIIGFSLGAHVAGFMGKHLKGGRKIGRITGLDPAFPLFPVKDSSQRLSKTDAEFVDVIHTNGGWFGYPFSVGHADFYPNGGGLIQPGCELSTLIDNNLAHTLIACSHFLAYQFYAESVRNPTAFPASKCEDVQNSNNKTCTFSADAYMGFGTNKSVVGEFYLTTNSNSPFSRSITEQEVLSKVS